jgi:tryptophan synthase alpha subunit
LNRALLPPQYVAFAAATAPNPVETQRLIRAINDPISRLIATGLSFRGGMVDDATLQAAIDTASAQGWRRPLLTYLKLQQQRTIDPATRATIRARIQLVEESLQAPAKNITTAP